MAQPRRKAIAIDDIKCRRDKMGGRSPVLFFPSCVAVCACARRGPQGKMSRCAIFAHTYVTLTWTSQTGSFCTRNGFPRGSQMAFRPHCGK